MSDSISETGTSAIEVERNTRKLPIRLHRETPWGRAIGCSLTLGLLMFLIAGGAGYLVSRMPVGEKDAWIPYVFMGVFGLAGAVLFANGVHQLFASRVRETIVEIDLDQISLGSSVRICFRQEGPVTLNSLRANLRCIELRHEWNTRSASDGSTETYKSTKAKDLSTQNILDEAPGTIGVEEFWEKTVAFDIPRDCPASYKSDDLEHVWKIEVWGDVRRWPDFMHPYVIEVVNSTSTPPS